MKAMFLNYMVYLYQTNVSFPIIFKVEGGRHTQYHQGGVGGFRRNLSCVRWVNACRPHHKRSVVTHLVQGRVKHTNLNWHVPICWICVSVYFPTSLLLGNFLFGFITLFIANSSIVFFSNYGDILFWFDFPNIEDISLISGTFCLLFPPTLYNLKNINF